MKRWTKAARLAQSAKLKAYYAKPGHSRKFAMGARRLALVVEESKDGPRTFDVVATELGAACSRRGELEKLIAELKAELRKAL